MMTWLRKPSPSPYNPAVASHSSPVSSFGRIAQPCASRLVETPGQLIGHGRLDHFG
jgi:hypothetical protein